MCKKNHKKNFKIKRFGNNGILIISGIIVSLTPLFISQNIKIGESNKTDLIQKAQISSLYEGDKYKIAIDKLGDIQIADLTKLSLNSSLMAKLSNVSFNGQNSVTLKDGYEIDAKIPKMTNSKQINVYYSKTGETGIGRISLLAFDTKRELIKDKNLAIPSLNAYIRSISSDVDAGNAISNVGNEMKGYISSGDVLSANKLFTDSLSSIGGVGNWFIIKFPEKTKVNLLKIKNIVSNAPNKTIALDFSDGTTIIADLNKSDLTTIQFPEIYTREIRVRILSTYTSPVAYKNIGSTILSNNIFNGLYSSFLPNAYATDSNYSTSSFTNTQLLKAYINESKVKINNSNSLKQLSENYVEIISKASNLGFSSSNIRNVLDDEVLSLIKSNEWNSLVGATQNITVSQLIGERLILNYTESLINTYEAYTNKLGINSVNSTNLKNAINTFTNGLENGEVGYSSLQTITQYTGKEIGTSSNYVSKISIFLDEAKKMNALYQDKLTKISYLSYQKILDSTKTQVNFYISKIQNSTSTGEILNNYNYGIATLSNIGDYYSDGTNIGINNIQSLTNSLNGARSQRESFLNQSNTGSISTISGSGTNSLADTYDKQKAVLTLSKLSKTIKSSFLSGGLIDSSGLINTGSTLGNIIVNGELSSITDSNIDDTVNGSLLLNNKLLQFAKTLSNNPYVGSLPTSISYGDSFGKNDTYKNIEDKTIYPDLLSLGGVTKSVGSSGFEVFEVYNSTDSIKIKDSNGNNIGANLSPEIRLFIDNQKGEDLTPTELGDANYSSFSKKVSIPLGGDRESILKLFALSGDISFLVELEDNSGNKIPIIINGTSGVNLKDGGVSATSVLLKKTQEDKKDYTIKINNVFEK